MLESTFKKSKVCFFENDWCDLIDVSMTSDASWHGSCLCMAEFFRLRIINDCNFIKKVLPFLFIALRFEVLKGSYLVGDNVRDAACYMAWCLARSSIDLSPIASLVTDLGKNLVSVMLLDREVHVRRAASAAFQEFLGRSKKNATFDNGLDILQLADYYSVGNLANVPQIAENISLFENYRNSLLNYIFTFSLVQPDLKLQHTAEKALNNILCIVLNLPENFNRYYLEGNVGSINFISGLLDLAVYLSSNTVLNFIEYYHKWEYVFETAISKNDHNIQVKASNNWAILISQHTSLFNDKDYSKTLIEKAKINTNCVLKKGYVLTLGSIGVLQNYEDIDNTLGLLTSFISCRDVCSIELIRNSAISIGTLITNSGNSAKKQLIIKSLSTLLEYGLTNYLTDHRGDVGSWVRLATLNSLISIISMDISKDTLSEELHINLAANTIELCLSLQSNIRILAGDLLDLLIEKSNIFINSGMFASKIGKTLYCNYPLESPKIDYISIKSVYTTFSELLKYSYNDIVDKALIRGFIAAAGNMSESISHAASSALIDVALLLDSSDKDRFLSLLLFSFKEFIDTRNTRLIMPTLRVAEMLISDQVFDSVHADTLQFAADKLIDFAQVFEDYYPEMNCVDSNGEPVMAQLSSILIETLWTNSVADNSNAYNNVIQCVETICAGLKTF
ncbi:hypothetical protein BB561_000522 [Smittium simulii]|uniref:Uncharacterized protein n=1 Tax=Smittium simulii TaxID=133385 RepID=A0A2T9YYV8_9FUNG|nr:hypothetical protein BB561_000522 [Smittium simulii]